MTCVPPDNPSGVYVPPGEYDETVKCERLAAIQKAPSLLRQAVQGLDDAQLDTKYKNWSVRQIVHHVADSHVHSYIRFRWTLTEPNPTIKAYDEAEWVALDDCIRGDIAPALALLDGLHLRWMSMLERMTAEQFCRTFVHPETGQTVSLWSALNYYAWHARHHTGQILWLREQNLW